MRSKIPSQAEARLQVELQNKRYKKSKQLWQTYGAAYRSTATIGQRNLLQLMRQINSYEDDERAKFDEELKSSFDVKVAHAKSLQERLIGVWREKLDAARQQQYCAVRETTKKFERGKNNRLRRLREIQLGESKKILTEFRKHSVHMRSLALRVGSSTQTTTMRPITPTIFGYLLHVLKRALPPALQSKTVLRDGEPLHDSKVGTVLSQFQSWIDECPELSGLSGRQLFALMDRRQAGRVTSSDLEAFISKYNFLIKPSILFNTVKKETPGVIQLDDFLRDVYSPCALCAQRAFTRPTPWMDVEVGVDVVVDVGAGVGIGVGVGGGVGMHVEVRVGMDVEVRVGMDVEVGVDVEGGVVGMVVDVLYSPCAELLVTIGRSEHRTRIRDRGDRSALRGAETRHAGERAYPKPARARKEPQQFAERRGERACVCGRGQQRTQVPRPRRHHVLSGVKLLAGGLSNRVSYSCT